MGLLLLIILAGCLLLLLGTLVVVHAVLRPPRTTFAEALAAGAPTDPGDMNLEYTVWACRTDDGLDLPVWDVTGAVDGPTMVWLHDHGRSRICDLTDVESWLSWCGRVVLVDLRGHGDAPGTCTLGRRECGDVDRLIDQVDADQLILGGRGFGGGLALEAASRHAGIAVWAVAPTLDAGGECARALRANHLPSWPLCSLALSTAALLGCRPIELADESPDQRIRIADADTPIPHGAWWS
jgi:pimeloyl-ACP methyl ester carboxylesterase